MITRDDRTKLTREMRDFVEKFVEDLYRETKWYESWTPLHVRAQTLKKTWFVRAWNALDRTFSLDRLDREAVYDDPELTRIVDDTIDRLLARHRVKTWRDVPRKWLEIVDEKARERIESGVDETLDLSVASVAADSIDALTTIGEEKLSKADSAELWNSGAMHSAAERAVKIEKKRERDLDRDIRTTVERFVREVVSNDSSRGKI